MEQGVPEGGEPKNVAAVIADILTKECPSSTFLQNVGLDSRSKKKFNRSASTLDAHVQELEYKLERERQAAELMREELVEVKKKSEETEAARAAEYQLLLQRVEATHARAVASDARFARLMDLFEGKIVQYDMVDVGFGTFDVEFGPGVNEFWLTGHVNHNMDQGLAMV